jgi:hypothetical protein
MRNLTEVSLGPQGQLSHDKIYKKKCLKMNLLNAFRDSVIASAEKHSSNTWMKLCDIAKHQAVNICCTVLYRDNARKLWH